MRRAFGKTIVQLAEKDENIFLISGDVEQEMDEYKSKFPDRYLNIGLCEQSMISICAGLATQGARQARRRPTTARRRATKGGRDRLGVVGDVERQVVDGVDRLTRVPLPSSSHLVRPYEEVWQPWQVCDLVSRV